MILLDDHFRRNKCLYYFNFQSKTVGFSKKFEQENTWKKKKNDILSKTIVLTILISKTKKIYE